MDLESMWRAIWIPIANGLHLLTNLCEHLLHQLVASEARSALREARKGDITNAKRLLRDPNYVEIPRDLRLELQQEVRDWDLAKRKMDD